MQNLLEKQAKSVKKTTTPTYIYVCASTLYYLYICAHMHASMNTHTVHALWHPHINQRSAGSRIAASLHQGLNINVWGQISSRGNPFKAILLSGWWFWLIYANLYAQFMQIWCFNLNQCVEWFEGFSQSYCVCASRLVFAPTYHTALFTGSLCLKSPFTVQCIVFFLALASPVQKGAAVEFSSKRFNRYFLNQSINTLLICFIPDALQSV